MPSVIKSAFVKDMEKEGYLEIKRWPMHLTDEMIINEIEHDYKLILYVSFNEGIPLYTHAGVKSFFTNIRPQQSQLPSYNKREPKEKHHQGQKD